LEIEDGKKWQKEIKKIYLMRNWITNSHKNAGTPWTRQKKVERNGKMLIGFSLEVSKGQGRSQLSGY